MRDYEVRLSQEQLEELEDLSGAGYCIDKIALYFDIPKKTMKSEYMQEDSWVRYHYDRGILLVDAKAGIELSKSAATGSITAIQQLAKLRDSQKLEELRKRIMYGEEID
ncbi:hypothetical protein [Chryseobacterium vrystaatense]|uniref:Uncharacterized protein n=1 Tax=Chryseobacterium vrystaatense TaxID=307480 RepID=A0ABR4UJ90_9FLAO|nr:hypothetical protein [Chryseobacterium vrystaatense]KFF24769.1 hypothetical protein IW16_17695 [Chryseobacterium vrystaatense]